MYRGLTLMFVSKQFRLTSKLWCVPLWSSYVKRRAMTAPSMWQISSCVSFVSCKILCNAWFHTQATNEFYRNVINNNKITPNKQASIIGSKEWHDEIWSSVLVVRGINIGNADGISCRCNKCMGIGDVCRAMCFKTLMRCMNIFATRSIRCTNIHFTTLYPYSCIGAPCEFLSFHAPHQYQYHNALPIYWEGAQILLKHCES